MYEKVAEGCFYLAKSTNGAEREGDSKQLGYSWSTGFFPCSDRDCDTPKRPPEARAQYGFLSWLMQSVPTIDGGNRERLSTIAATKRLL